MKNTIHEDIINTSGGNDSGSLTASRADANRLNAQRSTGPRTEEGKARSSQNARRAGWFARYLSVAEGQEQLYLEYEEAWLDELRPQGLLELEAFHDFLRASWHKREIVEAQNRLTRSSSSAFDFQSPDGPARARELDRLHRYERDFERRAMRHLRELRRLQTERSLRAQRPAESVAEAPPLAAAQSIPQKRTQFEPPESLFVDLLAGLRAQSPASPDSHPPPQAA